MTDKQKTKQELIQELDILRQRIAALEHSELARKRAEEALRDSEKRFKALFEESTEAQLLLDHSGKVVDCNTAFLDLFALQDKTESIGHTPRDFAPEFQPDGTPSLERGREVLTTVMERGSARYEWAHFKHDASRTPVLTELMCTLLSISGQPMIHVAIRDITARKRAEEALATSETRYRTLFEAANDAVFLHGVKQDGSPDTFVAVNNVAMQRLGFSAEEFTALTPADIDAGGFEEERRQAMKAIRSEGHATFEMVHQAKDGRRIPVEISSQQFVMADKTFILSIARDITERKRAEQALRESEERFRSLSDASLVGLMVHKQGVILDANLAFAQLFGYEQPEELIGKNGIEFMLIPESQELIYQRLQRQESGPIELTGVRKDGITFTAETDSRPIKYFGHDANIVSCRDITERKRAEEALRENEEQYRSLFETSTNAILIRNRKGIMTMVNGAAISLLGAMQADNLIGRDYLDFVYPEDRALSAERVEKIFQIATEQPNPYKDEMKAILPREHRMVQMNGDVIYVESTAVAFHHKGELFIQEIFRNITERKQAEEALKRSEEEAKRLAQENAIVAEIGRIISSTLNIEEVYDRFAGEARKLIPFDGIAINIINPREGTNTVPYVSGTSVPGCQPGDVLSLAGSVTGEVMRTRSGLVIQTGDNNELQTRFPTLLTAWGTGLRSLVVVPLISKDRVIGAIHFRSVKSNNYSERDLKLAETIGSQIAGAVANAQLFNEREQAEKALRESEIKYREIFESLEDLYFQTDSQGIIRDLSPSLYRLTGWRVEELIEKPVTDVYVDHASREKLLSTLAHSGFVRDYEVLLKKKDGTATPFSLSAHLLLDEQRRSVGISGILRDITERKQAEEEVFRSKEDWERTFDAVSDLIAILDTEYRIVRVNRAMAARLGVTPEECTGLPCYSAVHGTSVPPLFCPHRQLMEDGHEHSAEMHEERWGGDFLISVSPLRNREGRLLGSVHIARDITERKRAEEELRQSQRRFETLSAATFEGIVISEAGRLVDANEQLARMLGYEPAELIGMEVAAMIAPEDRERVLNNIRSAIDVDIEHGLLRKDGSPIVVETHGRSVLYRGRQVRITAIRDITVRKQAEKEKERLEAQLVQAQKMESIGRLAGGVAHDFNNMLGVIIGRVEMALDQVNPAESLHRELREIQKAAHRSADLTRQLLAFARKQTVSPKMLDLNDTVSGMLKMLQRLIGEDIDLVWIPGRDLWNVLVDPSQIDQILANLTVNARDAISGIGSVTLKTENVALDDSYCVGHPGSVAGEYVLLTVDDTGSGMTREVLDHLFEPFFTTKEMGKGTGLGLATVYGIVKQNTGFIAVESKLGKGTMFKIYLPRFQTGTVQGSAEEWVQKSLGGTESILLVEDDEGILGLCQEILETLGYKVVVTQTPSQAIRLVEEHVGDIHLLITDVVMPGMSGRELTERITALKPGLKCLYMSGYTADVIAHQGVLDEGIHFIQKPFRPNDFAKAIREVLEKK